MFRAMPRQVIRIPLSRLDGATPIGPGYTKQYTPEQMRMWADDLDRLNRTPPQELERWRATPPEQLSPEQRRVLAVHATYYGDNGDRLKGSIRDDGVVELDNGRHRLAYMRERGVESAPVWVSAADQRELDRLSADCDREVTRQGATMPGERAPLPGDRPPNHEQEPGPPRRPLDPERARRIGELPVREAVEPVREAPPERQAIAREDRPARSEERDGR
jgi:hypothetical protein